LAIIGLIGCGAMDKEKKIEREFRNSLVKRLTNNTGKLPVEQVTTFEWEYVFVLPPYQQRLTDDNLIAKTVNFELERINYKGDESYWALGFINESKMILIKMKRGQDLDLVSPPDQARFQGYINQEKFEVRGSVSKNEAMLLYFKDNNRTYILLGRVK
jgi:hypothetical protein